MAAPAMRLFIDSRVLRLLNKDMQDLANDIRKKRSLRELLLELGHEVLSPSIDKNFLSSGRPTPWEEVSPDIPYRQKVGKPDAPPLLVTEKLRRSAIAKARWNVRKDELRYGNFPRTLWFAVVHDNAEAAFSAGVEHRPFALIQQEDADEIQERTIRWIERKVDQHIKRVYV